MDVAHVVARFVLQVMTESILRLDQLKMLSMWKAPAHPRARVFFCLSVSVCVCVCLSRLTHLPGPVANDEGAGVSARMYGCAAGWMMQRAELARKQACALQMEQLQVPCLLFSCGRLMLSYVCVVSVCVCVSVSARSCRSRRGQRQAVVEKGTYLTSQSARRASWGGCGRGDRVRTNAMAAIRNSPIQDSPTVLQCPTGFSVQQPWLLSFNRGPQTIAKGVSVRAGPPR